MYLSSLVGFSVLCTRKFFDERSSLVPSGTIHRCVLCLLTSIACCLLALCHACHAHTHKTTFLLPETPEKQQLQSTALVPATDTKNQKSTYTPCNATLKHEGVTRDSGVYVCSDMDLRVLLNYNFVKLAVANPIWFGKMLLFQVIRNTLYISFNFCINSWKYVFK